MPHGTSYGHGGGHHSPEPATPHVFVGAVTTWWAFHLHPTQGPSSPWHVSYILCVWPSTRGWSGRSVRRKDWIPHLWLVSLSPGGREPTSRRVIYSFVHQILGKGLGAWQPTLSQE